MTRMISGEDRVEHKVANLDPGQCLPDITCIIGNEPRAGKHCDYPMVAQIAACHRDVQGQEPRKGSQPLLTLKKSSSLQET